MSVFPSSVRVRNMVYSQAVYVAVQLGLSPFRNLCDLYEEINNVMVMNGNGENCYISLPALVQFDSSKIRQLFNILDRDSRINNRIKALFIREGFFGDNFMDVLHDRDAKQRLVKCCEFTSDKVTLKAILKESVIFDK